jgi:plasmid stabilization system protein ParE
VDAASRIAWFRGLSARPLFSLATHWPAGPEMKFARVCESRVAGPHIIFYRVTDAATEIARVLDGRRDLGSIFEEDADPS